MDINHKLLKLAFKRLGEQRVVGLDIETITLQTAPDKWEIVPHEVALYSPKLQWGITLFINPYYWNQLTRKEPAKFFYPEQKYRNIEGFVVNFETAQTLLSEVKLQTVYGHNCLKFDFFILHNNGMKIRAQKIVDTFLEAGDALPLKYYTTLREWHEQKMEELKKKEEEAGELGLDGEQRKKFYKFFTEKGNLKMTAEAIYCYLSNNPNFEESHTALNDCIIEYEIYKYIQKRSKVGDSTDGNWMTVLFNFFSRFKRTDSEAKKIEEYKRKIKDNSYTAGLIRQFCW